MGPVVPQAFRYGSGGATKAARGGVGAALSPHEWFRRAPVITFAGPAGDLIFVANWVRSTTTQTESGPANRTKQHLGVT